MTRHWKAWVVVAVAISLADTATTHWALSLGGAEGNTVAAAIQERWGLGVAGVVGVAAFALTGVFAGVAGDEVHQLTARWGGRITNAFHALIVINNCYWIAHLL